LEIIKIVRNEDFSFGFTENIKEFMILGRDIEKVRSLCKFLQSWSECPKSENKIEAY